MPRSPVLLRDAKKRTFTKARQPGGTVCPCCTQHVQVYCRSITVTMAKALALLYASTKNDLKAFHKLRDLSGDDAMRVRVWTGGDFAKLRYWNLIQEREMTFEEKLTSSARSTGEWRITPTGVDFLYGRVNVKKYAIVFDEKLLKLQGPMIDIYDAVNEKFDFKSLMNRAP